MSQSHSIYCSLLYLVKGNFSLCQLIQTHSLIMLANFRTNSARARKEAQLVTFPVASVPLKMLYVNLYQSGKQLEK